MKCNSSSFSTNQLYYTFRLTMVTLLAMKYKIISDQNPLYHGCLTEGWWQWQVDEGHLKGCVVFPSVFLKREAGPELGVFFFFWGICSKMEKNMKKSRSVERRRSKEHTVETSTGESHHLMILLTIQRAPKVMSVPLRWDMRNCFFCGSRTVQHQPINMI